MGKINKKVRKFAIRCVAVSMGVMLASNILAASGTVWNVYADSIDYEDRENEKKSVMYYSDWSVWSGEGMFYPEGIPADQLTHLNFAFLDFDVAGNLIFTDVDAAVRYPVGMPDVTIGAVNAGVLNALQDLRAQNPNLRIGVSLGGKSHSDDFSPMVADPVARDNFVTNVMKFIKYTGMDFVDLYLEYPDASVTLNYITLLQDLRDALDEQEEELGKTYELSVALSAFPSTLSAVIDVEALFEIVDFANIMTYDLRSEWDVVSGHHTSLYTNPADPSADLGLSVHDAVQYLMSEGAPPEKIVIGAAFYTRGWHEVMDDGGVAGMPGLFGSTVKSNRNANGTLTAGADNDTPLVLGGNITASGVWAFRNLDRLLTASRYSGLQEYWDDIAKAPYLYSPDGGFFSYDNVRSIGAKTRYVLDNDLGGVMSWMQSNDAELVPDSGHRDELTTAIKKGLFGSGDLQEYNIVGADQNISLSVTTYSDAIENGYIFTMTNNEVLNESNAVLSAVERSFEAVKYPKLYIYTNSGATFIYRGFGAGTVTNENGHGVVDLASVLANRIIFPGQTVTFRVAVSGAGLLDDITRIVLAQRIIPTGAEISSQEIYTGGNGGTPIPTTTTPTNPTTPTSSTNPTTPTNPSQIAEYDPSVEYLQGDQVTYNGNIYQAKWWTQGEIPGESVWGAWELIG